MHLKLTYARDARLGRVCGSLLATSSMSCACGVCAERAAPLRGRRKRRYAFVTPRRAVGKRTRAGRTKLAFLRCSFWHQKNARLAADVQTKPPKRTRGATQPPRRNVARVYRRCRCLDLPATRPRRTQRSRLFAQTPKLAYGCHIGPSRGWVAVVFRCDAARY